MFEVLFLDTQKIYQHDKAVTGFGLLLHLPKSEVCSVLAMQVGGILRDLSYVIDSNSEVLFVKTESNLGLEIIRHDAAHIMAQAVKELFPKAQVTIGPVIKDGFFYDFAVKEPFTTENLLLIEERMQQIVKQDLPFVREVLPRERAIEIFKNLGEDYKVEIIKSIPISDDLTIYHQGDFFDLCRGPHSPSTGRLKAFKLLKIAGAYWRGDSKNPMLQRIYGTAWRSKTELADYLQYLEEAEKRDHRRIGKEMSLFHLQDEARGQVFWHNKGWILYRTLENYIRNKLSENGYLEVKTPVLVDQSLWEQSGHWEKFQDNMFVSEAEDKKLAIKPMNCPCHVQIFKTQTRSYTELPLRLAEFGLCHRNESSGSLHGLMRVRGFTQDDAHIFCTKEQITSETVAFCNLLQEVYKEFGFTEIAIKFSDRPLVRAGSDKVWDDAEEALSNAVKVTGLSYTINPGEGAFYGPKLEFVLKDAIGRDWQCGTLQVDFVLPERLKAFYVGADGLKHHPVMLHRAIIGTFERFIGILIEHYAGRFPFWLAPVQVVVATITNDSDSYAIKLVNELRKKNFRAEFDLTREKISYKIRSHSVQRVPVIWVVGKNEMLNNTVSVRRLGSKANILFSIDGAVSELLSLFG